MFFFLFVVIQVTYKPGRITKPIFTTDSTPDEVDSERESHIETSTTNTSGRKRKRTAGNMAVHDIRRVRCASSYSGTLLFQSSEL